MKKAVIIYHSKTGTTKQYGKQIAEYLKSKGIAAKLTSTATFHNEILNNADYIFFGCWTSGLMIMLQKPEPSWVEFASNLPGKPDAKVALFTTYKMLTGSMFKNMYKELKGKFAQPTLELKSRSQYLTDKNKKNLDFYFS